MDSVSQKEFEEAVSLLPEKIEDSVIEIDDAKFEELMEEMQNPIKAQQHLAVQIKTFLDKKIEQEMKTEHGLKDHTRRWVETYNSILEKIQRALNGDKSVNLHVHKISHSEISAKIREVTLK